ncbi:glycoside hydrolase family 130 protein [Aquirufa aurantiipilula]|uniref:Glycoside hydrolase family 130 protein n=1 Tax=Aquirufa aurantiipilula TaxID=2696561 RepID=A0ABT6BGB2_9BACT|nr:glycoside hydrolase family 130 protein [Aquirufa aurantiipilula]MDF5689480.1 glycoside hydrolase family 130 protein [Aquirufa aurantiipilula]
MNLPYKFISFLFFTSIYLGCFPTLAQNQSNTSWQINEFKKQDAVNPILSPDLKQQFFCPIQGKTVGWENKNVLNPTALLKDGKVHLLYRAQDSLGTSRIGLAISEDGIHFKKIPKPILFPEQDAFKKYEWPGGIEDPRIVQTEDGNYLITYTSYDGKTARLCFATSTDLLHWKKMGPMLKDPKYIDLWSKSGAIVVKQVGSKMIATKINGYYWMYFGDTDLFMAQSKDLIQWNVLEDAENKQRISVLQPRKGYFDSRLVEPGPYALMQKSGILLIYNSSNAANFNDTKLPKFTYSAAQALFHLERPYQLIQRSNKPFIWPNKVYEQIGEVNEVCFVEGLVPFKSRWFLYYGTADSKIAVATSPQR